MVGRMRFSPVLQAGMGEVMRKLPRLLAVIWGVWAIGTAIAYVDHVPPQLAVIDGAVAAPVWGIWATSATLLIIGAVAPNSAPPMVQNLSRWARITGLAIVAAMLLLWAGAFFMDHPRGWVSGKNYALLGVMAMVSSWIIARDSAKREQVTENRESVAKEQEQGTSEQQTEVTET